jgi:hypothetical protein
MWTPQLCSPLQFAGGPGIEPLGAGGEARLGVVQPVVEDVPAIAGIIIYITGIIYIIVPFESRGVEVAVTSSSPFESRPRLSAIFPYQGFMRPLGPI